MGEQETTGRPAPQTDTNKLLAALGYPIWIIALIMVLTEPGKTDPFVKYHGWQALILGVAGAIIMVALGITIVLSLLAPLVYLALVIYQIVLAVKAYNGEYFEVPVVYNFASKYME